LVRTTPVCRRVESTPTAPTELRGIRDSFGMMNLDSVTLRQPAVLSQVLSRFGAKDIFHTIEILRALERGRQ
jgi:hypothetical protein